MKVLARDIHNLYLTAKLWYKICTMAGSKVSSYQVEVILIVGGLYELNLSGENFRALLAKQLHDLCTGCQ